MSIINLKVSELRKIKGVSQLDLADVLGVSFQAVSKWETGITMPDITLLPDIAKFFNVSIDQLLGLKPLNNQEYIRRNTDNRENWNENSDIIDKSKKYLWNDDYLRFVVKNVWNIKTAVDVIDFRCGDGSFGMKLTEFLPSGSTYTGVDNKHFIQKAKENFSGKKFCVNFIESDLYSFQTSEKYDLAICQTGLRHINKPIDVLKNMVDSIKINGLVVCIEVNREFEEKGLFIDGISYNEICTTFDFHKLWEKELEYEGRDYAIGIKLPFYMEKLGLKDIDVRINDKVIYLNPDMDNYEEKLKDFIEINGWNTSINATNREKIIELFMSRGINRADAENYIKIQSKISEFFKDNSRKKSFLKVPSLFITYGKK